jgi:hypothetical protein
MAKLSYKETLLPKAGEDKQAFFDRINLALAARPDSKDRALLLASKAVATAWKGLDGMENPFQSTAKDDPQNDRESLEIAVILMADAIKAVAPKLDQIKEPRDKVEAAIKKFGGALGQGKASAVKTMVMNQLKSKYEADVKAVLNDVKGPFDALMDMAPDMAEGTAERAVADDLKKVHKDFREARKQLYPDKGRK